MTIQRGDSPVEADVDDSGGRLKLKIGLTTEIWKFKPSLQEEYERADLIISHAGAVRCWFLPLDAFDAINRLGDNIGGSSTGEAAHRGAQPNPPG
jgi:hypothetical protein